MSAFPPYPIRAEITHPIDWVRLGAGALRLALGASATRPQRLGPSLRRAVHLLGREKFRRAEILHLGLLVGETTGERGLARPVSAVSRRAMERIAAALNPVDARSPVRDKGEFHRACEARGLPVPALVAVCRPDRPARGRDGSSLHDVADLRRLVERECPERFVVKPIRGGYGVDVRIFTRLSERRFVDGRGVETSSAEIVAWMRRAGASRGCLIQARLRGAPELEQLSGTRSLQTARLLTLLDRDGEPRLLHAYIKLIAGGNAIDNFQLGSTGNLLSQPSLDRGVLGPGLTVVKGRGCVVVDRHPDTGAVIEGFAIPGWAALRELALRAARAFSPLRLVGWDIAPTADGPVLIEGNWNPDPPNMGGRIERVMAEIERFA